MATTVPSSATTLVSSSTSSARGRTAGAGGGGAKEGGLGGLGLAAGAEPCAGAPSPSSAMIRLMEARISSMEGSDWLFKSDMRLNPLCLSIPYDRRSEKKTPA